MVQASSPVPVAYTSLKPFNVGMEGKPYNNSVSSLGRCAAVSGKLEVRLMGCQALLEEVPGRSRRDKDNNSSPGDLRSFVKGVTSMYRWSLWICNFVFRKYNCLDLFS